MKRLYVGKLPYSLTEDEVRSMFQDYGSVQSVRLVTDRETGRPRGFGFVEMDNSDEADAAIRGLDGREVNGFQIVVNEARPPEERSPGGGSRGPRGPGGPRRDSWGSGGGSGRPSSGGGGGRGGGGYGRKSSW
jgi:cold-inducible RNA-binding protein